MLIFILERCTKTCSRFDTSHVLAFMSSSNFFYVRRLSDQSQKYKAPYFTRYVNIQLYRISWQVIVLQTYSELDKHSRVHYGPVTLTCVICDEQHSSLADMSKHKLQQHCTVSSCWSGTRLTPVFYGPRAQALPASLCLNPSTVFSPHDVYQSQGKGTTSACSLFFCDAVTWCSPLWYLSVLGPSPPTVYSLPRRYKNESRVSGTFQESHWGWQFSYLLRV